MLDKFELSQDLFFKCIAYFFLKIVWLFQNAPNSCQTTSKFNNPNYIIRSSEATFIYDQI